MATKSDVVKVIKTLADAYPSRTFANLPGYIQTAETVLRNIDGQVLEAAALDLIATSKWFPSLAELRGKAGEIDRRGGGVLEAQDKARKVTPLIINRDYVNQIEKFETLRPEQWTAEDHRLFRQLMGRPVNFENEDPEAPWMAWATVEIVECAQ